MRITARITSLFFAILMLMGMLSSALADAVDPYEAYIAERIVLYAEPSRSSVQVTKLPKNSFVTVTERAADGKTEMLRVSGEVNGEPVEGYILASKAQECVRVEVYRQAFPEKLITTGQLDRALLVGSGSRAMPTDGEATAVYADYGTYSGSYEKGVRSGNGVFVWLNGDMYSGGWKNDRIAGEGTLTLADGTVYAGNFSNNKFTKGTMTIPQSNGAVLVRNVVDGQLRVACTLTLADHTVCEGNISQKGTEFKEDVTIRYPNGDTYVGRLSNGLKSGKGTYTWKKGAHYVGNWKDDMMDGSGTYYYSSKEKNNYVKGTFAANLLEGTATYVNASGVKYTTTWKKNVCTQVTYSK